MAGGSYRIKLVKGDFQFEAEGDKAFVKEMLERFDGEIPSAESPSSRGQRKPSSSKQTDLASRKMLSKSEFIRQLGVKRHTDIVLAFGYYLEKYSGSPSFTEVR